MKRIFVLLFTFVSLISYADPDEIVLIPNEPIKDRSDVMPCVYYDTVNQQIIIDGGGEVTYYDVEIASVSTWTVVISTQVNGYYDAIDVSSLPTGEYCITIDSPTGNSFEGFFDTY